MQKQNALGFLKGSLNGQCKGSCKASILQTPFFKGSFKGTISALQGSYNPSPGALCKDEETHTTKKQRLP